MILSFSTMFVSANTRSISYPQSWVYVGESIQLSVSGVVDVLWRSLNTDIATVNSSTGKVTGVSSGTAAINATCSYSDGSLEEYTTYITVYDNRGIVNGEEYYVMNAEYDTLLSLASASTANNTDINLSARSTSTTKQWRLTQQSTGMYTIASIYTSSSKGLYVNSSANDVSLYTLLGSSRTHFEIRRINENPFDGLYLICYGSKYLAATFSGAVSLTSTLSDSCYWSLSRVEKGEADIFSFDYVTTIGNSFDSTGQNNAFIETFGTIGYSSASNNNATSTAGKNALIANDVFVFNGHYQGSDGGNGSLYFYTSTGAESGRIVATDNLASSNRYSIPALSSNGSNALASLRCVLYLACNTATDYGNANLAKATYNEGAHFVIGTTSTVKSEDSTKFLQGFLSGINKGDILSYCYSSGIIAAGTVSTDAEGYPVHYPAELFGDASQYLN